MFQTQQTRQVASIKSPQFLRGIKLKCPILDTHIRVDLINYQNPMQIGYNSMEKNNNWH